MSNNYKFNIGCLIGTFLFAALLLCSSCVTYVKYDPPCPVCEESEASEEHLISHCATNWEDVGKPEDPLEAVECLACGIYFVYPDYEEHIKTCYP